MAPNAIRITAWMFGILATLAGALGGAVFNYFFGRQVAIEAERRNEVRRAAEDYFSKRSVDPQGAVGPRYRLSFYASSDVLKRFAEANRIMAKGDIPESQQKVLCASQTPNARNVVEGQVRFVAAVRKQTLQGDPSDDRDLAAIVCPVPNLPCFGETYVAHLFNCSEAGAK